MPSGSSSESAYDIRRDTALLIDIRAGDERAFEALFRQHSPAILRFAYSLTGDLDTAKDLLHDLFLWVWNNRTTWYPGTDTLTYLLGAVRNRALNLARNTRRRYHALEPYRTSASSPAGGTPVTLPDIHLERREIQQYVQHLLRNLPEPRRSILILRWYHALGWDQIATILGLSAGAAKMQHQRALNALRSRLPDHLKK